MNPPLNLTRHSDRNGCGDDFFYRSALPVSLQRQSRLAAVLLFGLWLLCLFVVWPTMPGDLRTVASFLPGLVVAFSIRRQLVQHLAANHHPNNKEQLYSTLGAANWITLARAGGIIFLAGFLPLALATHHAPPHSPHSPAWAWIPGILYLCVALADLLDGYIARKQNHETELGQKLDMATDAAGLLVAGLVAVALGRLPIAYLLVGMADDLYTFGIWLRRRRALPVIAWRGRPYARIIAGCQMGLVAMVLLPMFHPLFSFIAGYLFMTPLLFGFVRDWLVISDRLTTDGDQQARIRSAGTIAYAVVVADTPPAAYGRRGYHRHPLPHIINADSMGDELLSLLPYGRSWLSRSQRSAGAGAAARLEYIAPWHLAALYRYLQHRGYPGSCRNRSIVPVGPGRRPSLP